MRSLIKKKQAILKKAGELSSTVYEEFTMLLNPFLASISTMGIYIEPKSQLVDTVFYPGNETLFDLTFLRKAILSHLQTGGVTIVVGHDPGRINVMIQTLALFLTRDERYGVRFLLHSRIPLDPTHVRFKLLHACDQWRSSQKTTALTGWHCKLCPNTEGASQGLP
jgi:hypothetical protein